MASRRAGPSDGIREDLRRIVHCVVFMLSSAIVAGLMGPATAGSDPAMEGILGEMNLEYLQAKECAEHKIVFTDDEVAKLKVATDAANTGAGLSKRVMSGLMKKAKRRLSDFEPSEEDCNLVLDTVQSIITAQGKT